jgi:hypothetical protein
LWNWISESADISLGDSQISHKAAMIYPIAILLINKTNDNSSTTSKHKEYKSKDLIPKIMRKYWY